MNNEKARTDSLIASGEKLGKEIQSVAAEAGALAKDYGTGKLQLARDALNDAHAAASGGARQVRSAADGFVRTDPWKAIGAAACVGMVVGLLLSRS